MRKRQPIAQTECRHKNKKELQSWRPNKRYGKFFAYGMPKKITTICADCGEKIRKQ